MSDRGEEMHQELMDAIRESHKQQLLLILHRLERLESPDESTTMKRLPSVETDAECESLVMDLKRRLTVLESRFEDEI